MTPPTLISVINQSTRVTEAELLPIVSALGTQMARDAAPILGLVPGFELVRAGASPSAGGCPCYVIDVPDVDGALGYHDEGDDGIPFIKVFLNPILDNGGTISTGGNSLSVTLSHEALEMAKDSPANIWADGPNGHDFAYEECDATEADFYDINDVAVSNFLFPAFFDPKAEKGSRFDFMGVVGAPFQIRPDGYQITRTEPGKVSQVFGQADLHTHEFAPGRFIHFGAKYPAWRKPGKIARAVRHRVARP